MLRTAEAEQQQGDPAEGSDHDVFIFLFVSAGTDMFNTC